MGQAQTMTLSGVDFNNTRKNDHKMDIPLNRAKIFDLFSQFITNNHI